MKYTARFVPQAWINDYAVPIDPKGPQEWDVTDWVAPLSEDDKQRVLNQESGPWDYNDDLKGHPGAPQWVKDHDGPFEIYVSERD